MSEALIEAQVLLLENGGATQLGHYMFKVVPRAGDKICIDLDDDETLWLDVSHAYHQPFAVGSDCDVATISIVCRRED